MLADLRQVARLDASSLDLPEDAYKTSDSPSTGAL